MIDMTNVQATAVEILKVRLIEEVSRAAEAHWTKPWAHALVGVAPTNAATGARYRGVNQLMLAATTLDREWETGWWAGVQQWNSIGNFITSGEHGTPGIRPERWWRCLTCSKIRNRECPTPGHEQFMGTKWRTFMVFNHAQTHGIWAVPQPTPQYRADRHDDFDGFVKNTKAEIREVTGEAAYYQQSVDVITLPMPEQFLSLDHRAATVAHELGHWTGHQSRTKRLDEVVPSRAVIESERGMEEFVAELCAAQVTELFGIHGEVRENHNQYLLAWLNNIGRDFDVFLHAIGYATKAFDYLISLQP